MGEGTHDFWSEVEGVYSESAERHWQGRHRTFAEAAVAERSQRGTHRKEGAARWGREGAGAHRLL